MRAGQDHLQLLFLLSEVAWLMRRDFQEKSGLLKMTQTQAKALMLIARREGLTQSVLAQRMEVGAMTIVRLIDRMQRAGLVRRRKDTRDRRAVGLYLTPKAKPALARMRALTEQIHAHATRGMRRADEARLVALLQKLRTNFATANGPQTR